MKINTEKYLIHSSTFIIFSEGFLVNYIIDWRLMYLIIITNYILLLNRFSLKINKNFFFLLVFILLHAISCYSALLIPPNYFISQILGILVISTYFFNVFRVVNINLIKDIYLKYSFYVALIGYVFYFLNYHPLAYFDNEERFMSIFKEPSHYVVVVFPACYYFLKNKNYLQFLTILFTFILSGSSVGFLGVGLMFLVPFLKIDRIKYLFIAIPILIIGFIITFNYNDGFKMRVEESIENLNALNNGKFDEYTNMSSYVFLSNMYIAKQNFLEHPFGTGIGSHHHMYTTKYYKNMRAPEYLVKQDHHRDNSFDANSFFTRSVSEFGVFGIILTFFIIAYFYKGLYSNEYLLHGIFIYIVIKFFRDGTYFPPELYYFLWMFYFLKKNQKESYND